MSARGYVVGAARDSAYRLTDGSQVIFAGSLRWASAHARDTYATDNEVIVLVPAADYDAMVAALAAVERVRALADRADTGEPNRDVLRVEAVRAALAAPTEADAEATR